MFGTTKHVACGKARRISARLIAWIVTFVGALADVWLILMLASVRMRCNSFVKSEPKLDGGAPVTRTVIGCSKRVKSGRSRPLSRRNDSSMKSSARSLLDFTGREGRGAPNVFIGGNVLSTIIPRDAVSDGVPAHKRSVSKPTEGSCGAYGLCCNPPVFNKVGHLSDAIVKFACLIFSSCVSQ